MPDTALTRRSFRRAAKTSLFFRSAGEGSSFRLFQRPLKPCTFKANSVATASPFHRPSLRKIYELFSRRLLAECSNRIARTMQRYTCGKGSHERSVLTDLRREFGVLCSVSAPMLTTAAGITEGASRHQARHDRGCRFRCRTEGAGPSRTTDGRVPVHPWPEYCGLVACSGFVRHCHPDEGAKQRLARVTNKCRRSGDRACDPEAA